MSSTSLWDQDVASVLSPRFVLHPSSVLRSVTSAPFVARTARRSIIRRLIFTCDLEEFPLRQITRSELPYPMNTSVDVLGTRIHATPFDKEDTHIVILRYEGRRCLLIS